MRQISRVFGLVVRFIVKYHASELSISFVIVVRPIVEVHPVEKKGTLQGKLGFLRVEILIDASNEGIGGWQFIVVSVGKKGLDIGKLSRQADFKIIIGGGGGQLIFGIGLQL